MKNFTQFIREATPPEHIKAGKFYHGTHSQEAAEDILKNGIKPREITYKRASRLTPVRGKVYLASNMGEALSYAMGGDIAGSGWKDTPKDERLDDVPDSAYSIPAGHLNINKDPYGYLFVVSGSELKDIDPDEDGVGEAVCMLVTKHFYEPMGPFLKKASEDTNPGLYGSERYLNHVATTNLVSIAKREMTAKQYREVIGGEYDQWAAGGKRIMKHLPDYIKHMLIAAGANIAHNGSVRVTECWRIDRRRDIPRMGRGKGFFDVAEKIK